MPHVHIPSQLRSLTGGAAVVELSGGSVREVIAELERLYPGVKSRLCSGEELAPSLQVTIDGRLSHRGIRAPLSATSEVHFLPAIGGG